MNDVNLLKYLDLLSSCFVDSFHSESTSQEHYSLFELIFNTHYCWKVQGNVFERSLLHGDAFILSKCDNCYNVTTNIKRVSNFTGWNNW